MTVYIKKSLTAVRQGFTLIELLIVIAILGVLAVVVLVAINPVQQLARTRDAGRISSVAQIGHAVEAYYTSHNGTYPTVPQWTPVGTNILVVGGELKQIPGRITATPLYGPCTNNPINTDWCYRVSGNTSFVVYAELESDANRTAGGTCNGTNRAFAMYSSTSGRGCVYCNANEPAAGASCP